MTEKHMSADMALSRFLTAVKNEAAESPAFRARLIEALDLKVLYEGEEQFEGANPINQAGLWSQDAFVRIWSKASMKQIKEALKSFQLATNEDMKGLKKAQLADLLFDRALSAHENDGRL